MPHQCTNCGRSFPDGSKEMLGGCPNCGGNKFQFTAGTDGPRRADAGADDETADARPSERGDDDTGRPRTADGRSPDAGDGVTDDGSTDESFGEWPETARRPGDRSTSSADSEAAADEPATDPPARPDHSTKSDATGEAPEGDHSSENDAQASARRELVSSAELPDSVTGVGGDVPPEHGRVVSEPTDDPPSIEDLREELNEQFESIKIVRRGEYELNLMELYDREEYIISLQEDGRYVIDVPDTWRETDE